MRYSPFVTVGQGEMTVGRASASSGRSHAEPRRRSLVLHQGTFGL
jgi:hypothetical protein